MAVQIEGVGQHAVPGFLAGLVQASETLGAIPARLEAARVHDEAFGKLFDAAKVRDAYHQRLPASEENIAEARQLINHFIAEFGGTPVELPAAAAATAVVPTQGAGTEAASPADGQDAEAAPGQDAEVTLHQAEPAEPAAEEPAAPESTLDELIPEQAEAPETESGTDEPIEPVNATDTEETEDASADPVSTNPAPSHPEPRHMIPAQGDAPSAESILDEPTGSAPAVVIPQQSRSSESVSAAPGPAAAAAPEPARAGWWTRLLAKLTGRDRR